MMTRLFVLALAAAGLSAGGFELGRQRPALNSPSNTGALAIELPNDRPVRVALSSEHAISPAEVAKLRTIADEMTDERNRIESQRRRQVEAELRTLRKERARFLQAEADTRRQELAKLEKLTRKEVLRTTKPNAKKLTQLRSLVAISQARADAAQSVLWRTPLKAQNLRAPAGKVAFEAFVEMDKRREKVVLRDLQLSVRDAVERKFEARTLRDLRPEVRGVVAQAIRSQRAEEGERGFALLIALRERDTLGLTSKQVTSLQLIQSDFIRNFAPLREAYENATDVVSNTEMSLSFVTTKPEAENSKDPSVYFVRFSVSPSEIDDQIRNLKTETDNQAYEVLTDVQQRRLRRMVEISLNPIP